MGYANLAACVADLEAKGRLKRVDAEVDPDLELAAIQRRLYAAGAPAVLFTRVKGTRFPCLANLYGTSERVHYLFRDTLEDIEHLFGMAGDPLRALKRPWSTLTAGAKLLTALPQRVRKPKVAAHRTTLSALPQLKSWPQDGGAYVTLPQVFTEHPERPGVMKSNLGMYRLQISGPHHKRDTEAGLHYQIHRGIGVHHEAALRKGEPLRVSIFVGGPPAHALAAVMPLPEGAPELAFAGLLAGRRFRYAREKGFLLSADADFCIVGTLDLMRQVPEGPFGDHLGYYSLTHDFPVLQVEAVYHRPNAIWPFTVVGRPPQEDSHFAELIHDLTRETISTVLPGVKAVHAVEVAGVHPLLLAQGSERYMPFAVRRPRELLTQAHAVLGFGQLSLAKFLWLAAWEDAPSLSVRNVPAFFTHMLERLRLDEDVHFITRTTMDTLDYSGHGLNQGSKVMVVAAGIPVRSLAHEAPKGLTEALPPGYAGLHVAMPGVAVVQAPARDSGGADMAMTTLIEALQAWALDASPRKLDTATNPSQTPTSQAPFNQAQARARWQQALLARRQALESLPLWILVDDLGFCKQSLDNLLWVAFTRCDPAPDSDGVFAFVDAKHWGCLGPWVLDARIKPHHAPPLIEDPAITRRIESMASRGGPLHGLI